MTTQTNSMQAYRVIVPSFIHLFVIRRILCKYQQNSRKKISNLLNQHFKPICKHKAARFILLRLVNNELKKYMKQWYKEKDSKIISMIFNQIILTQYHKAYAKLTKYNYKQHKKSAYYQSALFNTADVMCNIFQFLNFKRLNKYNSSVNHGDLVNCSFVCTHWLYHS